MARKNLRPDDPADYDERIKKTISNMEAAEDAMEFAEGNELKTIKEKNARREKVVKRASNEKNKE